MTNQEVKNFRNDFQKAIVQLEKQYGVNIGLGTIRFDENSLRTKMTAVKGEKTQMLSKDDFKVGDVVGINHKKINPNDTFKIIKISKVNIKVRGDKGLFTVSPNLLVKK